MRVCFDFTRGWVKSALSCVFFLCLFPVYLSCVFFLCIFPVYFSCVFFLCVFPVCLSCVFVLCVLSCAFSFAFSCAFASSFWHGEFCLSVCEFQETASFIYIPDFVTVSMDGV